MSDSAVMVGGRYRLLRTIGRGGMGTVWQAHDEVLGRDVAVKQVLPPPDLTDPERDGFAVRTFREARAAGRVAHPGVAAVYDVLEERGHPWIVMQLVHSRTLGELIRDDGPMTPVEAAGIGLQLLSALRAAHAAGVLHRDVKPDNVLLAEDGRAVLTDFGIATTEDDAPLTRTGVLIGTPAFMAPERAAGGQARPASDLWSLGVTLYLAVEGRSPFQRDNPLATLGAVMHAEPEPLSRAGVLGPVLLGLLRKNPGERMSLEEAEWRLAAITSGGAPEPTGPVPLPSAAPPSTASSGPPLPTGPSPASPPPSRRRALPLAAVAAATVVVGVVTGGAAWWSSQGGQVPGPPSQVPSVVTVTPSASPSPENTASGPPRDESSPPRSDDGPGTPYGERRAEQAPSRQRPSDDRPSGERSPDRRPSREPTPRETGQGKDKQDEKRGNKDQAPSHTPGAVEPSGGAKGSQGRKKPKARH
ncbi:protein kinase [Nonomuraea phyllanthi]|uniref:non-specific serine/threonine protein kinase n=1 Tax=Nonomuraea phyllanthi TaxID=2219224 RepID=A0A5C4VA76_9ACTN|nr:protein kinase [Nonomuraea phyllanthi]KAB8188277.1 protein kinase [Nonomuraea phyllanthi]